jgi:hypothetical protein
MMTEEIIAAKSGKVHAAVAKLLQIVANGVEERLPAHVVEQSLLKAALAAGRAALQLLFDHLGAGDVGETCRLEDGRILKRLPDTRNRTYQTVFGAFELQRHVYATREGQKAELVPLDARLQLPESKFSYLLQDFDQHLTMEEPFQQVAHTIQRILDVRQHVDSLERMNQAMASHVDTFHVHQEPPPASEEGAILVETADGKGVPIRRPADAPRIEDHEPRVGPKPDRKKMATLASVYSVDPYVRTPQDVVEALFRDPKTDRQDKPPARPRPCHKRVRACLNFTDADGEELLARPAMFGWLADEVKARNPQDKKPLVCIMDGQEDLWTEIELFQPASLRVEILDLLHVTPRLWKAARIFTSGQTQAASFVRSRLLSILQGGVEGVIRGLKRMASLRQLRGASRKTIAVICAYLWKNRHRMRYHEYLAKGYPIASGVIEGACRHVVKDRLERTGMNWTVPGAKAMLELRCVHLSGEWDTFLASYIDAETEKLHPHRGILEHLTWNSLATSA